MQQHTMSEMSASQNKMPYVSVIIPTYNRASYVTEAINSVLAQTYTDYEVIIVDDGSTDRTREVIAHFRDLIRYIYQDNQGLAAARNTGIKAARGKWIAFLDSDDLWLPEKLTVQIEDLSRNPELHLHTTNATIYREHIGKEVNLFDFMGFSKLLRQQFSILQDPLDWQVKYGFVWAQCALVRTQAFISAGMYDTRLTIYTDLDMFCRVAFCGPWGINKDRLVRIRRDERQPNISQRRIRDHLHSKRTLVYLFDKLHRICAKNRLSSGEKRSVEEKLCFYKAALGMELLKVGKKLSAREMLREAFIGQRGLKALFRYSLSFLPSCITARVVRSWHRLRCGQSAVATCNKGTNDSRT
jgi:glycosyltransferase involved in cell wall biosynthesis